MTYNRVIRRTRQNKKAALAVGGYEKQHSTPILFVTPPRIFQYLPSSRRPNAVRRRISTAAADGGTACTVLDLHNPVAFVLGSDLRSCFVKWVKNTRRLLRRACRNGWFMAWARELKPVTPRTCSFQDVAAIRTSYCVHTLCGSTCASSLF